MTNENIGSEAKTWMLDDPYSSDVEYTRTDLHQAELAAVIEVVLGIIREWQGRLDDSDPIVLELTKPVKELTPPDATAALQAERDKSFNEGVEALYERLYSEFGHTSSWDLCVGVNDAVKREVTE